MIEIVQKDDPVLRQKAKNVPVAEISSPKIKKVLSDMEESLNSQDDGVAIAAPQIGIPLRIFVVSKKISQKKSDHLVFINPKILKLSKKKNIVPEGCLSVRWLYGDVKRSTNASVEAYNENGKKFTRGAGGLLAQIFQHEIDHLDGVLFIDKADNLQEIPPETPPVKIKKNGK